MPTANKLAGYNTMACENYDPCYPDQPVVDRYLPIWASQPAFKSKPAFIWADSSTDCSSITYSQLNSSVQSIATNLLLPLQRGDTLLILCSPGLQLVKIIFACQRAGLVAVPLIPPDVSKFSAPVKTPAYHHLLRVLRQTNPKAAVADHRYISTANDSGQLYKVFTNLQWLSIEELDGRLHETHSSREPAYSGFRPEETYLVQYTSGATGIPKPVTVSGGAAAHNVRAGRKAYDLHPGSVIVTWLPQYHDCGLMFLLLTVVSGATCVLTSPSAFLARPRLWLELISEFKATCTPVPSFTLPLVAKRGGINMGKLPLNLHSLRNLVLINEPIYKSSVYEFVNEFICVGLNPSSISPSYGLAENCTFVSTAWQGGSYELSSDYFPNMPAYKKLLPSARLARSPPSDREDIEIMVVDEETCEPVEDGVEGEIWVSSASSASGYLDHPSLTREVFNGRLPGRIGQYCFVRTGDRGVIRGDQRYLYVIGRSSDVIRVGDQQISHVHPHYLEIVAYESNPMHLRGGCIAAFEAAGKVVVVAELLRRGGGGGGSYRRICEGIRERVLKEEGVRVGMVMLAESGSVPKTTSGKLRRFLARDLMLKGRFPVVFQVLFEGPLSLPDKGEVGPSSVGEASAEGEVMSFAGVGPRSSLQSFL